MRIFNTFLTNASGISSSTKDLMKLNVMVIDILFYNYDGAETGTLLFLINFFPHLLIFGNSGLKNGQNSMQRV